MLQHSLLSWIRPPQASLLLGIATDLAGKIRTDRRKRTLTLTAHHPSAANQTTSVLCWLLAEELGDPNAHGVQRLLAEAEWDEEAVRDDLRAYVIEHLGEAGGVLVVDETGFVKKGKKSAGVARQYSGTAGRRENSQIGVFLLYASTKGYAFIDRALYLPEEWTVDRVPGDTIYGYDELRMVLEKQQKNYVLAVPETHTVWVQGRQQPVGLLAALLPQEAWVVLSAGEGSKGSRLYEWAWLLLPAETEAPSMHARWVLMRRSLDPVCVRTTSYGQVLASRNTAEASKAVFVASSLGVYGCPCSSHQVIASTSIVATRSGTNISENG